jgi:hypothetical protein
MRDDGYLRGMCLESLYTPNEHMTSVLHGRPDLQQPAQERNIVGPFLLGSVPEGESALDSGRISSEPLVFLMKSCTRSAPSQTRNTPNDIQFSAALRVARGTGLERPDPGGEKSCRLAVGSADMLCLAGYGMTV